MNRVACLSVLILAAYACQSTHAAPILVPTVIFSEDFNSGLPGAGWSTGGSGTVSSVAGTAQLADAGGDLAYYTTTTFGGEVFTVEADVNQLSGGAGSSTNGILIGNRAFTFFGNFSGGAFNIINVNPATGAVTGTTLGDTNMGYTPLQGVVQHYKIEVDPFTNTFDIQITNTGGPGVFNLTQVIPGFVAGGVGFFNWSQDHTVQYDNIQVIALREFIVPEPSTFLLLGLGTLGLAWRGRGRRSRNDRVS